MQLEHQEHHNLLSMIPSRVHLVDIRQLKQHGSKLLQNHERPIKQLERRQPERKGELPFFLRIDIWDETRKAQADLANPP